MAVSKLFPRYFRVKNQRIHAVGEMPAKFVPSDEDDADVESDDADEDAAPREKKVPPRMQAKLALIEELRAAGVEGSTDDTVAVLRAKLKLSKRPTVVETPVPH